MNSILRGARLFALSATLAAGLAGCWDDDEPKPPVVATADTFTLALGQSGDLLLNDSFDAAPATAGSAGNVSFAVSAGTLPAGMSAVDGVVTVGNTTAAGDYSFSYSICEADDDDNCATATVAITVPPAATVTGRAVDAATGLGIAGVRVSAGAASAITDTEGNFSLVNAPVGDRVSVVFDASAFGQTVRVASLQAGTSTDVQARLVRSGTSALVDVAAGGTVSLPGSTAQVVLPAGGVRRADGSTPTGNMTVKLTVIDPAIDSSLMPGDFTTLVGGTPALIESFGALNVELSDAAGAALNLAAGQTATLRIPLASRSANPPPTVPLYYFDNATGRWVEEGSATLVGSGATAYYEGTVSHFTTWNADQVYNTVLVSGCVADAVGARVAGAYVAADGVDYSGTSSAVTDAEGNFVLPIRLGSVATATGISAGKLTNTLRLGPYAADTALGECLALGQTGAGISIKLTWGALPSDLDSYLFAPDGSRVSYIDQGSLVSAPFANLDVDDTDSYGPEVVTVTRLMVGTYKYSVNNYVGYDRGPIAVSGARVELNLPDRPVQLFTPPVAGESVATDWWNLFEFDVDASCNVTLRPVGSYSEGSPASASAEPVYCTAP